MAAEAGYGYRGDRQDGTGGGRAGRGMDRIPGRGNGRGGEKNKYSWKRSDDGGNSNSSQAASGSGDTSHWDGVAATKHREVQGGAVWMQKAQTSSDSGGKGIGQQSSPASPHGKNHAQVMEILEHQGATINGAHGYRVEIPDEAVEVIPTPPLVTEENLRFSLRNVQNKMERVDNKAMEMAKKRELEGLMIGEDRKAMEHGAKMLRTNASTMMRICAAPADAMEN